MADKKPHHYYYVEGVIDLSKLRNEAENNPGSTIHFHAYSKPCTAECRPCTPTTTTT
jgi:hypothetical protein